MQQTPVVLLHVSNRSLLSRDGKIRQRKLQRFDMVPSQDMKNHQPDMHPYVTDTKTRESWTNLPGNESNHVSRYETEGKPPGASARESGESERKSYLVSIGRRARAGNYKSAARHVLEAY